MNLIFDFDGTLVDSFTAAIKIFNLMADEFHFRKATDHEIPDLKHLNSHEFIKYFKIPMYKIPSVLLRARTLMRSETESLSTYPEMTNQLQILKEMNVHMGIVTSNSAENVNKWLARHHLQQYFSFIHDEPSLFGKHRTLKKLMKAGKMDKQQTYYVGDETRDIEAAKKSGITSIAVTWGFNSERALKLSQPDFLATTPSDIVEIIRRLG